MTDGNIMRISGDQRALTPIQVAIEDVKALKEQGRILTARIERLEKEIEIKEAVEE